MDSLFDGKVCRQCEQWKLFSDYYRNSRGSNDGYETWCKVCFIQRRARYYAEQRNSITEQTRTRYKQDPNFRQKLLDGAKEYRAKNRDQKYQRDRAYVLRHPEQTRKYKKAYVERLKANNPIRYYAWIKSKLHRRQARKRGNGGSFTRQEWQTLCERYDNICLACKQSKRLTADHVVPLSKGGSNDIGNIQPLCMECNLVKRDRTIDYRW